MGLPFLFGFREAVALPLLVGVIGGGAVLVGLASALLDLLRWQHTTYRITPERVELRKRFVVHSDRSIPRDRVRSVDLTADPVQRIFGVVKVTVGTGQQTGGDDRELKLEVVSKDEGELLRALLLHRAPRRGAVAAAGGPEAAAADAAAGVEAPPVVGIATMDWAWLRLAPLSGLTLGLGVALTGGVYGLAERLGLQSALNDLAVDVYESRPLWLLTVLAAAVLLASGTVATLALIVEGWWGLRVEREAGERLLVRRGLVFSRSLTLEERRLRGVLLREPLLMRPAGGAILKAVATGLRERKDDSGPGAKATDTGDLLPPAPRAEVDRVAAAVLNLPSSPTATVRLAAHPPAALRRRVVRAVMGSAALTAVLAVAGAAVSWLPGWLWVLGLVALPPAVVWARLAYSALGHGLSGAYLVVRSGGLRRDTVALQRAGVIGWRVNQSVLQRRADLLTVTATTAAGAGAYRIIDAGTDQGLTFAKDAVPGLLTPFLEHR